MANLLAQGWDEILERTFGFVMGRHHVCIEGPYMK